MYSSTVTPHSSTPLTPTLQGAPSVVSALEVKAARLDARIRALPEDPRPFADKYFLNTEHILSAEGLNPWVRAQVMIRQGPGIVSGVDETLALLLKYTNFFEHGGTASTLRDGDPFGKAETLMLLDGPIQDIVALETMYLGILSAESTLHTDGVTSIDLEGVRQRMAAVVAEVGDRPVIYFGARHWRYDEDGAISSAAFEGGASACSTDAGAATIGKKGVGTIPHVLENIMAWKYGPAHAVVEATKAFDRVIDAGVPRIALIDYRNREIDDSLATARALEGRLYGVRVDTCGENIAQGAIESATSPEAIRMRESGLPFPEAAHPDAKFWYGRGVTVSGVYALRKALDAAGFSEVKIVLSSGFADVSKVRAFVTAEKLLGIKLFDSLGVGGVYESRSAKMDIVRAGNDQSDWRAISKAGRSERPNSRLSLVTPEHLKRIKELLV